MLANDKIVHISKLLMETLNNNTGLGTLLLVLLCLATVSQLVWVTYILARRKSSYKHFHSFAFITESNS